MMLKSQLSLFGSSSSSLFFDFFEPLSVSLDGLSLLELSFPLDFALSFLLLLVSSSSEVFETVLLDAFEGLLVLFLVQYSSSMFS